MPESSVDLIHIEKSYYLGPDKGGERAYQLLSESMKSSGKIAVGRFWTRGKVQLVLIRPYHGGLLLHYVFYANEVRGFEEIVPKAAAAFKDIERELATRLIEQLSSVEFKAEKYRDEYQDRVRDAVDQKIAGKEIAFAESPPEPKILDLFEALKRSIKIEEAQPANAAPPESKGGGKKKAAGSR